MHLIDKGLTVRSLTGHEMILGALERFAGTLCGKKREKIGSCERADQNGSKHSQIEGVRKDFPRLHVGRVAHLTQRGLIERWLRALIGYQKLQFL
jgi:hypothetical protein